MGGGKYFDEWALSLFPRYSTEAIGGPGAQWEVGNLCSGLRSHVLLHLFSVPALFSLGKNAQVKSVLVYFTVNSFK